MRVGIVGHGFVGKALDAAFPTTDKFLVDPKYNTYVHDLKDFNPDVVFVCVPASMKAGGGVNFDNVRSSVAELAKHVPATIVVIKSTVSPDVLGELDQVHPRLVYNPEFLTEANADHDFVNPPMLVLGGKQKDVEFVHSLYEEWSTCNQAPTYKVDIRTASFVKYAINSFLAVKVSFFNELYGLYHKVGAETSWDMFTRMITTDKRIGDTHVQVPGPDGRFGWSGSCFPRDTDALHDMANRFDVVMPILEVAITCNTLVRAEYEPTEREKQAGIIFEKERWLE